MTVRLYKMARVECDECHSAFFDVYTHETYASAPAGWKLVRVYRGSYHASNILCCPTCVEYSKKNDRDFAVTDESPAVDLVEG